MGVLCSHTQQSVQHKSPWSGGFPFPPVFEDPTSELNRLGKEGWELVSTYTTVETKYPNFGNQDYVTGIRENTHTGKINFVLKRRVDKSSGSEKAASQTPAIEETVEAAVEEEVEVVTVDEADSDRNDTAVITD